MNAEIYQVSKAQFEQSIGNMENRQVILSAANLASEIIVGIYAGEALCYIGLCPRTLLSDDAYIWMLTTKFGLEHPKILVRYSKGTIETILCKYSKIFGHCFESASASWLKWLGAEFISKTEFEFRRG